jgi:hypothetical protein
MKGERRFPSCLKEQWEEEMLLVEVVFQMFLGSYRATARIRILP